MVAQTVVWTVLPNGVKSGRLHLSVFVSPRLEGDSPEGTLAPFTDWHDWPAKKVDFFVTVGNAAEVKADPVGPAPRSDLWKKLFTPSTRLVSKTGQVNALAQRVIRSAPTKKIKDYVREEYATIGAWFATDQPTPYSYFPPSCGGFAPQEGGWPELPKPTFQNLPMGGQYRDDAIAAIRSVLGEKGYVTGDEEALASFPKNQITFLLLEQFHNRNQEDNPQPGAGVMAAPLEAERPRLDFHTAIGAIGEYPAMLRTFGLVRDISIPLPAAAASVLVSVRPVWSHIGASTDTAPATECAITATTFVAVASPGSWMKNGLYELDQPSFDVVDVDADAGATKLLAAATSISRVRAELSYDPGDLSPTGPQPPPAVESAGLSLVQVDRAAGLNGLLSKATSMEASLQAKTMADTTVNAEDLNRGFRLDVWDDVTKAWHSLCLRKGTYSFAGVTVNVDDEGTIIPAHTEQPGDPTIYLHESLARWTGYSLVAPRPGKGTADDGGLVDGDTAPDPEFNLKATFKAAPGTLPKLRFGRSYKLRARLSDLAGNGLKLGDVPAAAPQVSETLKYRRFEPVPPPNVLLRQRRTEGESHELMVIRSNYNKAPTADSQRHLAPQRIAELTAEQHGLFDVPKSLLNPGGMNKLAYSAIADKDPGSFADSGTPDPSGQDQRYYDVDQLKLPYFPDVLSRGAAFVGLPGAAADSVMSVDFDFALLQKWPDARPFRIQIVEGSGAPKFDPLKRILVVQIPKGRRFNVRYSSRITAADRELLGTWGWLADYVTAGNALPPGVTLAKLQQWAVEGRLWQLTPYRTLNLVHAIRQPLTVPTFTKPIAIRKIGDTTAKISDRVTLDRQSTIRLDLVATWKEPLDLVGEPAPQTLDAKTVAYSLDIEERSSQGDTVVLDRLQDFQDMKYRKVNYELIGTTRFAEYFVERKNVKLVKGSAIVVSAAGIVNGSDAVTLTTADPRVSYTRGVHYEVDNTTGTVTALLDALHNTTVEVAFVAPPITRSSTETKPVAVVDVPSTARPTAPDVAYVVPTFGWNRTSDATKSTSQRLGHGLRVYLRRPWYSSGDGEQLGVVVPTAQPDATALKRLDRYITRWAEDPAFASAVPHPAGTLLPVSPLRDYFPLAVKPKSNLKLAESDRDKTLTDRVSVAPHAVGYDTERQLWYSDITIDQASIANLAYTPFIRLALARYQPISITGVELSSIVLAQFAQLSPHRTMSVVYNASDPTKVQVTVVGKSYAPVAGKASRAAIKVLVQSKNPALQGDVAWSTTTDGSLAYTGGSPTDTWSGTVTLPAARGSKPFRLVVEESEQLLQSSSRLVYVDAIQI